MADGVNPRLGPGSHRQREATVKSHMKISDTEGGFAGTLDTGDRIVSVTAQTTRSSERHSA